MFCIFVWILLLSLAFWHLGQDPYGQAPHTSMLELLFFSSIYLGFPSRLQLMTMNKLPRAWWKLCSSERSTHALPTIASQEQHLSTCAAWGTKNGRLKMRCIQVNTLLKIFSYILKNSNIILKYRIKFMQYCSKAKLYFCDDIFWLSLFYSIIEWRITNRPKL